LPASASVWMKLHGGITDTIAFQEMGFTADVQFTSEIAPARPEMLWRAMRDKTRNVIRRAGEQLKLIEERDPERFATFYRANLDRRSLRSFYDFRTVRAITEECLARNAGRIIAAVDKAGAFRAAVFSVWDHQSEYYLMSTRAVDAGNGASSLLIWEAIQHAAERGLKFDFDGARNADDTRFFAGFGGSVRPRYWVWRKSFAYRAVNRIYSTLRSSH
jgi:lipid II:glycine glycyltransferase (peptidoglycan interpeptide bridge formation enzyme)